MKVISALLGLCLFVMSTGVLTSWAAESEAATPIASAKMVGSDAAVMRQFLPSPDELKEQRITNNNRHKILFFMGLALLIFLITTASLGVAMVIFKKSVYVTHMLFGGLSVTLAIAHAVVAMVWFYPF